MNSHQDFVTLQRWVAADEGLKLMPYDDGYGNLTVGYGFNLKHGLSVDECVVILQMRLKKIFKSLVRSLPYFLHLDTECQMALINMAYQMGVGGLLGFTNMLSALSKKDRELAVHEALNSKWAKEFPVRAQRITDVILGKKLNHSYLAEVPQINFDLEIVK